MHTSARIPHTGQDQDHEIGGAKVIKVNTADGFHFSVADGSWVLVRFSGTEPILRIYAEASSLERANSMIAEGKKLLGV